MTTFEEVFSSDDFEEKVEDKVEEIVLSFQLAVQDAMDQKGVTKKQLAELMNVKPARVSQLLGGHAENLTLKSIAKVALVLDVDFDLVNRAELVAMKARLEKNMSELRVPLVRSTVFWKETAANSNGYRGKLAA